MLSSVLRRLSWILSAWLVLVAGCASTGSIDVGAPPLAEEASRELVDEVMVGREMAAALLGRFGAYREDAAALEYVNLVGQSLAQTAGRPEIRFRFAILDTDEAESFSTPGGYVFVTRGLLGLVVSEAELAGLLAHEIAHVNGQHVYLRARDAAAGLALLTERGLPREVEMQADETGSQYLASAGYDALALAGIFKRLPASGRPLGQSLASLPERVARLDKFLAAHGLGEPPSSDAEVMNARFQRSLSSIQAAPAKR